MGSGLGLKEIIIVCFSVATINTRTKRTETVPGVGCCISGPHQVLLEVWGSVWNFELEKRSSAQSLIGYCVGAWKEAERNADNGDKACEVYRSRFHRGCSVIFCSEGAENSTVISKRSAVLRRTLLENISPGLMDKSCGPGGTAAYQTERWIWQCVRVSIWFNSEGMKESWRREAKA